MYVKCVQNIATGFFWNNINDLSNFTYLFCQGGIRVT